jgi:hypothetical protein
MEQKNSNTLLWIAVLGLAYWVWYTRRQVMAANGAVLPNLSLIPPGVASTVMQAPVPSDQMVASQQMESAPSTAQTVVSPGQVPLQVNQGQSVNGVFTTRGRFGAISSIGQ